MYDVEYDIVRLTYDVVGCTYDIVRRRTMSYLARIQMIVAARPEPTIAGPKHGDAGCSPSGILTTWYKRVYTCFKHVCTSYVQCLSTAADRHGIYKNENPCTCFKHVHTYLQIHVHVCTWYVHGMYKGSYKRVCTSFKHVCTCL